MFRSSLSLSLIVWLLAVPLIVDHCARTCETTHSSAESTPPCHHDTAQSAVVGGAPERCGHDHGITVAINAADPLRLVHSGVVWSASAIASTLPALPTMGQHRAGLDCSSPPISQAAATVSPLRI